MRNTIIMLGLFLVSIFASAINFFFRDKFLFYLHGYDPSLLNSDKAESFNAYKTIHGDKPLLILVSFIIVSVSAFITKRFRISNAGEFLRLIYLIEILLAFLLLALLLVYFILPKRLM